MAAACYAGRQTIQALQCGNSGDSDSFDKFKLCDGEHSDSFGIFTASIPERRQRKSGGHDFGSYRVGRSHGRRGRSHERRDRAGVAADAEGISAADAEGSTCISGEYAEGSTCTSEECVASHREGAAEGSTCISGRGVAS